MMDEAGLATRSDHDARAFSSLLPLYIVIFFGFVGYSLMITIFTPMFLKPDSVILPPVSHRRIARSSSE